MAITTRDQLVSAIAAGKTVQFFKASMTTTAGGYFAMFRSPGMPGAATVNSVALPARATGADDVELWLEIYTALGASAVATVTASYTNSAGVAGRTATLVGGLPASSIAGRTFQMSLQSGDTGVQSVQSVTLGSSSGTAGAFGMVMRRGLVFGNVSVANTGWTQGYAETDLQIVQDDACIEVICLASATTSGTIQANFGLAQG
jgi:hypothetical protein